MLPRIDRILAATDLSPMGDAALPWAFALADPGNTVFVVHALDGELVPSPLYAHYTPGRTPTPQERERLVKDIEARLHGLVPPEAEAKNLDVRVEVVEGPTVAAAIAAAAERHDVHAIVLGFRGRSALAEAILGSVTHEVARLTRRPIVLARPPE